MKIYVDLIFILNVWIDLLLLLSVSIILKRNSSLFRIIIGSIIGGFSTFFLFFNFSNVLFLFFKILVCFVMILVSFSFSNLKCFLENVIYFYLVSVVLAGVIYLIRNNYNISSFKENFLLLLFLTPLVLFIYYQKTKKINNFYNKLYEVKLYYNDRVYRFVAFLDTGNRLYDQYKKRPIILVHTNKIRYNYAKGLLVPYETVNGKTVLKCLKAEKIVIDNSIVKYDVIFGLASDKFNIENVNMILHEDLIGG